MTHDNVSVNVALEKAQALCINDSLCILILIAGFPVVRINQEPIEECCEDCPHHWSNNWNPPPMSDAAASTPVMKQEIELA